MEAIESVRQQTYTNWEIILVDDGSTDNSQELYKELEKDNRIHIFYNEKNMGCGYTKARCADLATGEICGFLDPDDALVKDALQVMVEAHGDFPKASLINSTYYDADENLNIISSSYAGSPLPPKISYLESGYGITHFATFKKCLYNKTEGIDVNVLRAVDQDLYYKLEEVGEVHFVNRPLYIYRQNTGLNISLGENEWKAVCWNILIRYNACKRRNLPIEKIAFLGIQEWLCALKHQIIYDTEKQVRNTKSYKLGYAICHPFHFLKKKR